MFLGTINFISQIRSEANASALQELTAYPNTLKRVLGCLPIPCEITIAPTAFEDAYLLYVCYGEDGTDVDLIYDDKIVGKSYIGFCDGEGEDDFDPDSWVTQIMVNYIPW